MGGGCADRAKCKGSTKSKSRTHFNLQQHLQSFVNTGPKYGVCFGMSITTPQNTKFKIKTGTSIWHLATLNKILENQLSHDINFKKVAFSTIMISIILASLAATSAASGGVAGNGYLPADGALSSALVAESRGQISLQFTVPKAARHLDPSSQRIFSLESPLASTTLLTGNIFFGRYSDDACTSVAFLEVNPLNVCINVGSAIYEKYTATASTYDVSTYSDAACTTVVKTSTMTSYDTSCSDSVMTYVSTSSVVSSVTPMASFRLVVLSLIY